jgi:hypothetical protein
MSKSQDSAYKAHIRAVIDHLQIILKMIDWDIGFSADGEHSRSLNNNQDECEIDVNTDYKQAWIFLGPAVRASFDGANLRHIYTCILHELIHCHTDALSSLADRHIPPALEPLITTLNEQLTVHMERVLMDLIPPINYDPTRKSGKVGKVKSPVAKLNDKKVVK